MAFEYYDYEVDPFDSDAPGYLHFQSNYYSGTDDDLTAPATANFPDSKTGETPTRYFLKTPYIIDVSDLTGTRPISLRDTTLGVDLTRVSASPGSGEYRIVGVTSERRYIIEFHSAQAGNTIDYDLYALGTVITGGSPITGTKVMDIGDWNMDSTYSVSITHGILDFTKIRSISVMIINDAGTTLYNLAGTDDDNDPLYAISRVSATSTNIVLSRTTGGAFDDASFDSTSYNRGYIYITYEV